MKRSLELVIVTLMAASPFAHGQPKEPPAEEVIAESMRLMKGYRIWLKEKPRKLAIQFLEAKGLPDRLAKLGFKCAAIEEGLVILISTDDAADPIEGIAIATDGKNRSNLLRKLGWEVSDSSDPRIKHLKRNKAQQAGALRP